MHIATEGEPKGGSISWTNTLVSEGYMQVWAGLFSDRIPLSQPCVTHILALLC